MVYTIEHVDEAWNNFKKYTETAEQHEFVKLAMVQFKFEPYYIDLHENWDEHHAALFMKAMAEFGKHFGFKVPELKGE